MITPPVLAKVFRQPGHLYRTVTAAKDEGPVEIGIVPAAAADNDSDDPEAAAVSNKCAAEASAEPAVACAGQRRLGGGGKRVGGSSSLSEYCASWSMKIVMIKPMMITTTVIIC